MRIVIKGPLGIRAQVFDINGDYASPSFDPTCHFDRSGLMNARCGICGDRCPSERSCSGVGHGCGIYVVTGNESILQPYGRNKPAAVLLVEGRGKIVLHEYGFRAKQVFIRAVVKVDYGKFWGTKEIGPYEAATWAAAKLFNRPIISMREALAIMEESNQNGASSMR